MKRPGRRIVATMLVVVGLGGIVGGCYYPVPAPPPVKSEPCWITGWERHSRSV